jgi:arginine utilization regulatory protein
LRRTAGAAKEKMPVQPFADEIKPLKEKMREFETYYIQRVVEKHNGNISRAARELGISRQSLQYRLRKLGVKPS